MTTIEWSSPGSGVTYPNSSESVGLPHRTIRSPFRPRVVPPAPLCPQANLTKIPRPLKPRQPVLSERPPNARRLIVYRHGRSGEKRRTSREQHQNGKRWRQSTTKRAFRWPHDLILQRARAQTSAIERTADGRYKVVFECVKPSPCQLDCCTDPSAVSERRRDRYFVPVPIPPWHSRFPFQILSL